MDERMASTVASYDAVVDDYVKRNGTAPSEFAVFRRAFFDRVGHRSMVADLGCGPGRDAVAFAELGVSVVGVDLSIGMLTRASRAGVTVVQGDIRHPPLQREALDGVWSAASLLHVSAEDVPATLLAWRRLLRAGGALAFSTSLGGVEGWELTPYASSSQPERNDLRRWFVHHDRTSLLSAVAAAGFKVVSASERESHRRWLQVLAVAN